MEEEQTAKGKSFSNKMKENPWIASTGVLAVLVIIMFVFNFSGGLTGNVVSSGAVGTSVLEFASMQGLDAELIEINKDGDFYEVVLLMDGQQVPIKVTRDGKYIAQLIPIIKETPSSSASSSASQDIPKSNSPKVELFIMTHCPYGTQAEKGLIPTLELLGDSIDAKIRFVHYFMHDPEETETPRQVCIREEQPAKWYDYLECFLEDGDSDRCLNKVGVDKAKMDSCISSGKAEDYYAEDSALSEGYGVQGSPTLVINGVQASSGRDSLSYLNTICSTFNTAPGSCEEDVSSAAPSPGFGYSASGSNTQAQC